MDITALILEDHHEQRRFFARLEEIDRGDTATLAAVWARLSALLEVHAVAEERFFYPELLRVGEGAGSKDTAQAETKDAIHDHNQIRDAIATVGNHAIGGDSWFDAVAKVNKVNSDHMGEEEREALADFRRHADLQLRHELARRFTTFEALHIMGLQTMDKDPQEYVAAHQAPQ